MENQETPNQGMPNQQTPNPQNVNEQFNQQFSQQFGKQMLPNSTAVLVLGIISIVGCVCIGIVGLICGIIALVLVGKSMKLLRENPTAYTESSVKNMKAGKVCAIIGTSLSTLYFIYWIVNIIIFGTIFSSLMTMPWNNNY